ncbi:hypothetical protein [Streptomyces sp. SAJ15]|uniref:hypothetical protein n=1 Tax=Streptomyces sp. SAJ15 TaxID=2011095 RepID=UPI001185E4FF|nr:hypothetical protein [Streptomyces sp. SAJ15]TVL90845.1 hypothetical protein CD790_19945 [Streptomyces sp. SAJ15]
MSNAAVVPPEASADAEGFVRISAHLTGFRPFDLHATGMARPYLDTVLAQVGRPHFDRFVRALVDAGRDPARIEDETCREIARAITYLWYLGSWPRLPRSVHAALEREVANVEFVVSPQAYTEGLVWRTFGGHPPGAKPPGFGTWADPPHLEAPAPDDPSPSPAAARPPDGGAT